MDGAQQGPTAAEAYRNGVKKIEHTQVGQSLEGEFILGSIHRSRRGSL